MFKASTLENLRAKFFDEWSEDMRPSFPWISSKGRRPPSSDFLNESGGRRGGWGGDGSGGGRDVGAMGGDTYRAGDA